MRKLLIVLALLTIQPVCWQPLWGQSPRVGVSSKQTSQTRTNGATGQSGSYQIGTPMRPLVVDIEDHVKTPIEAANAENEAKRASEITRRTLDAYEGSAQYAYWTAWGTWVLVLVGSGGIIAAVETLHKIGSQTELMERQTKVMEGQIALAEAPFRQWLELRDWDAGLRLPAFGEGRKFGVRVNLVNTTSYPITLDEGEIVFDEAPYGRTAWSAGADRFI